jgi:uncharacterized protein
MAMVKGNNILQVLNSLNSELSSKYKVKEIGVFGSFVRGEENENSDIDLLVEFDEKADLFDYMKLTYFLEEKLGHKVDIVSKKTVRRELRDNIFREVRYK